MTVVYIGVGSNIQTGKHIRQALGLLSQRFGEVEVSPMYACPAVGFTGDEFVNLVVRLETSRGLSGVLRSLRDIEAQCGRVRGAKTASRTMDLDLLLFDDLQLHRADITLPRDDILRYAFVLKPLMDIAGDALHPVEQRSYAELWAEFRADGQPLREVMLDDLPLDQ